VTSEEIKYKDPGSIDPAWLGVWMWLKEIAYQFAVANERQTAAAGDYKPDERTMRLVAESNERLRKMEENATQKEDKDKP
jgi:hypothetical protein